MTMYMIINECMLAGRLARSQGKIELYLGDYRHQRYNIYCSDLQVSIKLLRIGKRSRVSVGITQVCGIIVLISTGYRHRFKRTLCKLQACSASKIACELLQTT